MDPGSVRRFHEADPVIQHLILRSWEAANRPGIDKSPTGSAVLCGDGTIYASCSSPAATTCYPCSERQPIEEALADGHSAFTAIAVSSSNNEFISVCEDCRQHLLQFHRNCLVYLTNQPHLDHLVLRVFELPPEDLDSPSPAALSWTYLSEEGPITVGGPRFPCSRDPLHDEDQAEGPHLFGLTDDAFSSGNYVIQACQSHCPEGHVLPLGYSEVECRPGDCSDNWLPEPPAEAPICTAHCPPDNVMDAACGFCRETFD